MRMTTGLMFAVLALLAVDARGADDVVNERVPKQGLDAGKAAYLANCAACHQPEGTGLPGAFPPLAGFRLHQGQVEAGHRVQRAARHHRQDHRQRRRVQQRDAGDEPPQRCRRRQHRHLRLRQLGQSGRRGQRDRGRRDAQDAGGHERPLAGREPPRHLAGRDELPGRRLARRRGRRGDGGQSRRPADQQGRVQPRHRDLLPALRRLPWRAAQGRDRQAADARHHPRQGHGLPRGADQLRFARRHAELGQLGRADQGGRQHHGALPPARPAGAAGVGHAADARELEPAGAGRPAPDQADARPQHRQLLRRHPARFRRGGDHRRRHQGSGQHPQDRLRGPHLAPVALGPLRLHHRPRRQDRPDRPVDEPAGAGRRDQDRPRGAFGRDLEVQGLRGQARDRRRLLAAAVRDHGRPDPGADQDRVHPRHDRRHAGVPPGAARRGDRGQPRASGLHRQREGDRPHPPGRLPRHREPQRRDPGRGAASCTTAAGTPPTATSSPRPTSRTRSRWSIRARARWRR